MHPPHVRALVAALALTLSPLAITSASADPGEREPAASSGAGQLRAADALLDHPVRGEAAIRALGDQLPTAAGRNDLRAGELRSILRTDHGARLDRDGQLHYVEPAAACRPPTARARALRLLPPAP